MHSVYCISVTEFSNVQDMLMYSAYCIPVTEFSNVQDTLMCSVYCIPVFAVFLSLQVTVFLLLHYCS